MGRTAARVCVLHVKIEDRPYPQEDPPGKRVGHAPRQDEGADGGGRGGVHRGQTAQNCENTRDRQQRHGFPNKSNIIENESLTSWGGGGRPRDL